MWLRVISSFFLLALLSACAASGGSTEATAPTPTPRPVQASLEKPTYTVQRGLVVDQLKLSGFVAAVRQQELNFTQNGFLKVLYVERTSVVTKGQLLAELDLGELPNQLRQAEVQLEQAESQFARANAQRDIQIRRAELDLEDAQAALQRLQQPPLAADVEKARLAIRQAEIALEETRTSASSEKTRAELALKQASLALPPIQAAYLQATERWNDVKGKPDSPLHKPLQEAYLRAEADLRSAENNVAQAQLAYDTARQNEIQSIQRAEANLAEAQAALKALYAPPNALDLANARRAVIRAELALDEVKRQTDEDLEKTVTSAKLEVERIQAQIQAGRLYAPFDGVISEIRLRPGESVDAYRAMMTIIDDAEKEVLIDSVTSTDSGKIGIGQEVTLVFSRVPGREFKGSVVKLPSTATSTGATINPDRSYHIAYEAPDIDLEVGDLAQVVVTLKQVENALWLPPQAVRTFEGRRFVVVQDGNRQRRQDVRVGIISQERVEILEGLNEGDVVVGQ
jgi:multidrug efflux pump subunit AcrA (membrane-fusion protein)